MTSTALACTVKNYLRVVENLTADLRINIEYVLFLSNYFGGKLIVRLKGYPNTKITVSKEKAQRLKEWIDK